LRDVSGDVHGERLRLRGRRPSSDLKPLARAIAAEVEGVRRVVNRIDVAAPAGRPGPGRERASRAEEP